MKPLFPPILPGVAGRVAGRGELNDGVRLILGAAGRDMPPPAPENPPTCLPPPALFGSEGRVAGRVVGRGELNDGVRLVLGAAGRDVPPPPPLPRLPPPWPAQA